MIHSDNFAYKHRKIHKIARSDSHRNNIVRFFIRCKSKVLRQFFRGENSKEQKGIFLMFQHGMRCCAHRALSTGLSPDEESCEVISIQNQFMWFWAFDGVCIHTAITYHDHWTPIFRVFLQDSTLIFIVTSWEMKLFFV